MKRLFFDDDDDHLNLLFNSLLFSPNNKQPLSPTLAIFESAFPSSPTYHYKHLKFTAIHVSSYPAFCKQTNKKSNAAK